MSDKCFKRIEPGEIDKNTKYCGYLWRDNKDTPDFIDGIIDDIPAAGKMPYIIEGNLMARDGSHSISIRFVDGEYIITKMDLEKANENGICFVSHNYLAHPRFGGNIKKLCFKEAWLPVDDLCCAGMEAQQPAWIAFVGFDYKEEENND